jgi:formamidopyrimidine-DNA glycosylase
MPELPEVQTVVTTLQPRVTGRRIRDVRLLRSDIVNPSGTDLAAAILGRRVGRISRRGKRIVFTLDDRNCFYIHLGMTGQLTAEPADREVRKHTHLILGLDSGETLRFRDPRRFGGVFWLGCDSLGDESMGPEPLDMGTDVFAANLKRTTRAIKNALLDQRVVAGLGNIYVDESLYGAGIHPLTASHRLKPERVELLCQEIKRVLTGAIAARGSTLRDYVDGNGELGTAQSLHRVYARESQPCPNCGTPIKRIVLGGRSTHFCPKCQRR